MRHSLVSALLAAGLVIAATAVRSNSEPAYAPGELASGELIAHVTSGDGQSPLVTVIDPKQRVMAIYEINRTSGKIIPRSVRNITWDLQMIQYNSGDPLPQDIRSGLQR
jgi:hypothetical protein